LKQQFVIGKNQMTTEGLGHSSGADEADRLVTPPVLKKTFCSWL